MLLQQLLCIRSDPLQQQGTRGDVGMGSWLLRLPHLRKRDHAAFSRESTIVEVSVPRVRLGEKCDTHVVHTYHNV